MKNTCVVEVRRPVCLYSGAVVKAGVRRDWEKKGSKKEIGRERGAYLYGGYVIRQCWVARAPERQESASQGLPSRGEKIKIKSAWKAGVVSAQTCAQSSRAQV